MKTSKSSNEDKIDKHEETTHLDKNKDQYGQYNEQIDAQTNSKS